MSQIAELTRRVIAFRDQRNWSRFHQPKDVVLSLLLECAELAEHFQWKDGEEIQSYVADHRAAIGDELSDVLYWVLLLANDLEIDLVDAFERKLQKNAEKYPVEKARDSAAKYTEL